MALEARDITFGYPGAAPLYRGLSLAVEAGERVALRAPSGAGKTTLCRLLAGYLAPQEGSVSVDGASMTGGGRRAGIGGAGRTGAGSARAVQLIWQHPEQAFDPRMRMGRSLAEGAADLPRAAALERARGEGLIEAFGIRDEWLSRLPHELSGGELMRFCIVRALLAHPAYLICDEMSAMLDALTQAQVWRAVLEIAGERGMGLVVVSHDPALVAQVATREVVLPRSPRA